MSFTINTNVSARIAGLYSGRADSAIAKSVTRLSSGKKLLSPADIAVEPGQLAKQKVIRESSLSMQVQANRLTYLGLTLIGAD